ncbi:MAG: hypothetical protein ACRD6W_10865, partial [Nitrososphaerales archaeon]
GQSCSAAPATSRSRPGGPATPTQPKRPARTPAHWPTTVTAEQFRYSFGNAISEEEPNDLYQRWVIPRPGRPLFEAAAGELHSPAKVNTRVQNRIFRIGVICFALASDRRRHHNAGTGITFDA